jgi:inosine-uridine nucleoside N-ribohydrolase
VLSSPSFRLSFFPLLPWIALGTALLLLGPLPSATAQSSEPPTRVIVDSDANNELDDQHALAYALLSGEALRVEGITVNRTDNGGDLAAQMEEARRILRLTGLDGEVPLLRGASGSYETIAPTLVRDDFDGAEAVDYIIERAHASDRPLVVIPIGKLTNVALALEKDPSIASEIRVVWLGSNFPQEGEYNLKNDPSAVNPVIESGVPFEIAVVRYGRSTGTFAVQTFQPEIQELMPGLGPTVNEPVTGRHGNAHTTFGDYSVALFDHVDDYARALYDVAAVAVVKNPDWGTRRNVGTYRLNDGTWVEAEGENDLVIWELFHTSKIVQDFFDTLRTPVPAVDR